MAAYPCKSLEFCLDAQENGKSGETGSKSTPVEGHVDGAWTINTGWEDGLGLQTAPLSGTARQDAEFWRCQAFSLLSHPCARSIAHTQTIMVLSYRLEMDIT